MEELDPITYLGPLHLPRKISHLALKISLVTL
jgi:hypothetical protein